MKQRQARFGVAVAANGDDKLAERAKRFATPTAGEAPSEAAETEAERKRKRMERFGAQTDDDKKKQRLERFQTPVATTEEGGGAAQGSEQEQKMADRAKRFAAPSA